jgi:hypothetical protein
MAGISDSGMSIFTRHPPSLAIVKALCSGAIEARKVRGVSSVVNDLRAFTQIATQTKRLNI